MTLSFTSVQRDVVVGSQKETVTDVTLDSSYPTGGEAITAAQLGLNGIHHADTDIIGTGTNATATQTRFIVDADQDSGLLKTFDVDSEIGNGTNLSDLVVRVTARGW